MAERQLGAMLCRAGRPWQGGLCPLVGISWGAVGGPWVAEGQMFQQDHITLALH